MADKNADDLKKELLTLFETQKQTGVKELCVLSKAVLEKTYGISGANMVEAMDDLHTKYSIRAVSTDNGDVSFMPAVTTASQPE